MNLKKICDGLIASFIIILLCIFAYQVVMSNQLRENEKNLQKDNAELNEKIGYLENQIQDLINQNELLNNQLNHQPETPEDTRICTFTRTYHYLETLEERGMGNETLIVVRAFQDNPFILRLENNFDTIFEKNAAYEIQFTGSVSNNDNDLSNFKILSINKTNKVGLEQVQEPCRVEE